MTTRESSAGGPLAAIAARFQALPRAQQILLGAGVPLVGGAALVQNFRGRAGSSGRGVPAGGEGGGASPEDPGTEVVGEPDAGGLSAARSILDALFGLETASQRQAERFEARAQQAQERADARAARLTEQFQAVQQRLAELVGGGVGGGGGVGPGGPLGPNPAPGRAAPPPLTVEEQAEVAVAAGIQPSRLRQVGETVFVQTTRRAMKPATNAARTARANIERVLASPSSYTPAQVAAARAGQDPSGVSPGTIRTSPSSTPTATIRATQSQPAAATVTREAVGGAAPTPTTSRNRTSSINEKVRQAASSPDLVLFRGEVVSRQTYENRLAALKSGTT